MSAIREEVLSPQQLDGVLGRADSRHRVEARVERAADEALATHGGDDSGRGDGGADNRQRSGQAA